MAGYTSLKQGLFLQVLLRLVSWVEEYYMAYVFLLQSEWGACTLHLTCDVKDGHDIIMWV